MVRINSNYLKTKIFSHSDISKQTKSNALDGQDLFKTLVGKCNDGAITKDMAKLLLNALEAGKYTSEFYSTSSNDEIVDTALVNQYNSLTKGKQDELTQLSKQWLDQKENFRPSLFCLNTTKSYMAAIDLLNLVAESKVNQKVSRYGTSFSGGLRVYSTTYKLASPSLQEVVQINKLPDKLPVVDWEQYATDICRIRDEQHNSPGDEVQLDCETYRGHVNSIKGILESNARDPRNILDDLSSPRVGGALRDSVQELIAVLHRKGNIYSLEGITPNEVKTAKYDFMSCLLSIIKCNIERENKPLSQKITQLEGELKVLSNLLQTQGNGFIESDGGALVNNIKSSNTKTTEVGAAKLEISKQNNLNYNCLDVIYMIAIADNKGELDDWIGGYAIPSTDDMLSTIKAECKDNASIIDLVATLESHKEFICPLCTDN